MRYPARNSATAQLEQRMRTFRSYDFTVDAEKIRVCLGYLMDEESGNPLYRHVELDNGSIASLKMSYREGRGFSLDEALDDSIFDEYDARYCSTMDLNPVTVSDIADVLRENYSGVRPQNVTIERSGNPVRPHEVRYLLAQAFPTLFPHGGGDYRYFPNPMSTGEFLEHTVLFGDPKFSQHLRYIFMMVNMKNLDTAYRSIGPALKGRVLQRRVDGRIEDMTEEMFHQFAKVVRSKLTMLFEYLCCRTFATARSWML